MKHTTQPYVSSLVYEKHPVGQLNMWGVFTALACTALGLDLFLQYHDQRTNHLEILIFHQAKEVYKKGINEQL